MAAKEITELLPTGGAAGDSAIGLDSSLGLVRRDSVPYDKGAEAVDSSGTDMFIGVSVSGEARTFNAIPYIKGDAAATPAVDDLVVGVGNDGSAKQFTVVSLATTLEGESFGTGAFTNVGTVATLDTGTGAGEVPTNDDLGTAAFLDQSSINYSGDTLTIDIFGASTYGTKTFTKHVMVLTIFDASAGHVWADFEVTSYTGAGQLRINTGGLDIQYEGIVPATYDSGSGPVLCYANMTTAGYYEMFNSDGTVLSGASAFTLRLCGMVRRAAPV